MRACKRGRRFERRLAERKERAAMKEVVNTQDVERWTKTLGRALEFLNGGK